MPENARKMMSVVVSVYNEEPCIESFYTAASGALGGMSWDYELIFVDDGSCDASARILGGIADSDPRVKLISLSRNFGHEAAMIAGIDYASGDAVVCMDADLQHPPELLPEIAEKFDEGWEIVSMVRGKNEGASRLGRLCSSAFYKLLNHMSPVKFENNSSDFFAVSGPVADILRQDYRERVRYLRGYVQSIGFKKTTLSFDAGKRLGGKSKYSLRKLVRLSVNALCSFSDLPLKLGIYSGCFVGLFGLILMIYTIVNKFLGNAPSGYSTIVVALCFMFAVTLFVIGLIGQYIAIVFAELKGRPIYIVRSTQNVERDK